MLWFKYTSNRLNVLASYISFSSPAIDLLVRSAEEFNQAVKRLQSDVERLRETRDISQRLNVIRIANNKLMNIERTFIHPEGLPGRP